MAGIGGWGHDMKVLARVLGVLVGLVVVGVGAIYVASTLALHRTYDVPVSAVRADSDSSAVERGRWIARTRGCTGCHGSDLSGTVLVDGDWWVGRLVAPNLTRIAATIDDADLGTRIREGVRPDGRSLIGMPSEMYFHLSDADLSALLAYLHAVPANQDTLPDTRFGILARIALLTGEYRRARDLIDETGPRIGDDSLHLTKRRGEYLVRTSCPECHGVHLEGDGMQVPSLAGAAGYTEDQFVTLVRTGEARDKRQIDSLMIKVAMHRLSQFDDEELREIQRFLRDYSLPPREAAN
ncbi:MAG: c-type cytochrome [Gemmatimonadaceae bacterium]